MKTRELLKAVYPENSDLREIVKEYSARLRTLGPGSICQQAELVCYHPTLALRRVGHSRWAPPAAVKGLGTCRKCSFDRMKISGFNTRLAPQGFNWGSARLAVEERSVPTLLLANCR